MRAPSGQVAVGPLRSRDAVEVPEGVGIGFGLPAGYPTQLPGPRRMTPQRTWIVVDLSALLAKARTVLARNPGARLLPMVKADVYGLGAVPVARALEALDPWGFWRGHGGGGRGAAPRRHPATRPRRGAHRRDF
jgi:hypothetical protein